jgi:hypothetical protein
MNPARMCLESLDRRPGIREQPGSFATERPSPGLRSNVRYTPDSDGDCAAVRYVAMGQKAI